MGGTPDIRLATFLTNIGGHTLIKQGYTWIGKECQAALDHVVTWNYHLPLQFSRPNPKSHKRFDHNQIWTQLPQIDFPEHTHPARTSPLDFPQRIDTVFFKMHTDDLE